MPDFDVRGEFLIGGVWVDATGNILSRQALTHSRGRRDQGARVDPSTLRPLINNTNGQFSPDNPTGPHFGKFGRNTPFRLSAKAGSPALDLPGAVGDYASTPDAAALDITGDIDIRIEATLSNWTQPAEAGVIEIIGKYSPGSHSWLLDTWDGLLEFQWSTDGIGLNSAFSSVLLPVPASGRMAVRVAMDVNVAPFGDHEIFFYTAPSIAGPWTQLGNSVIIPAATSIFAGTAPLRIGDASDDTLVPAAGRVHKVEIRNGINGSVVANPDFTAQAIGAGSFVDGAGRTWTLNGNTSITNRRTRLSQELAAYPARWHASGAHAWVEATTAGILRRYRRGSTQLESTLRRRIPSHKPLAYWPLEDGASATQGASPIAGVKPARLGPVNWASVDTLPSSSPLPGLNTGTSRPCTMSAPVPTPATTLTAWHVQWVYYLATGPATQRTMLRILSTGTVAEWTIQSGTGGSTVIGKDDDGATVFSQAIGTGSDLFGQWMRVRFEAHQSGGSVAWSITWTDVGGDAGSFSSSFAGTVGRPTSVASHGAGWSTDLDGMAIGHISVWPTTNTTAYDGAIDAWTGETAGERMQRLATEENLPLTVCGAVAEQEPVGPQLPAHSLELLEEAADADGGILYEDRERPALRFRGRATMYNQTPALTLAYAGGVLGTPLEPTGDDDATENDVTVSRVNGSSARVTEDSGPLSVLAPPDGVGPYPVSTTLNLHSDLQTPSQAGWRLHLGTWEGRRYPQVRVRVHKASAALLEQILAVDVGDLIRLTGMPIWVAPGDVDLIVLGYEETWRSAREWDIVFNCAPGGPWSVGVRDDAVLGRRDTAGSELASPAAAADTELAVATTLGPWWVPARPAINGNPRVASDLTGWSAASATIARVAAPPGLGSGADWAIQVTPDGVSASGGVNSDHSAAGTVAVAVDYTVSCWVYSPGGWSDLRACVDWYDAADAYISSSLGSATAVTAGQWVFLKQTFTAPVSASRVVARARHGATPAAANVWYATQITVRRTRSDEVVDAFPLDLQLGGEVVRAEAITGDARYDLFGRSVSSGWGGTDVEGFAWTTNGGAASDYSVAGAQGVHTVNTSNINRFTLLPAVTDADFDLRVDVASSALAAGANQQAYLIARFTDTSNYYGARLEFTTSQQVTLTLIKTVAGVATSFTVFTTSITHAPGTRVRMRFQGRGSTLRARAWLPTDPEPAAWQVTQVDTQLTGVGQIGCRTRVLTGGTVPVDVRFTSFVSAQSVVVARAVNTVVKPQLAGESLSLAYPTRRAL
ncbi:hypothetical protein AB0M28_13405 [Streptomyces sp. NPDC051940]|uniref:hypothetical protein n=1 Tax=Streptomyces sp. NPDC051940 TaxID=3155675 RepID=UPI003436CF25